MNSSVAPLDFRRLEIVAETEQEKMSFLNVFFEISDEIVLEMETACRHGALTQWKDAAHKLRGAASNVGMASLEKICLDCETISGLSTVDPPLLKEIKSELRHIKRFVSEEFPVLLTSGTYGHASRHP